MKLLDRLSIEALMENIDPLPAIEQGFVDYSHGKAIIPPVGELLLEKGEVHIKYGALQGGRYYVVKVASGFYGNVAVGLPSSNGLMLLFDQDTGAVAAVLLDEGLLTDIRTAAAGAIAARHLAPREVRAIGIVGAGIQARLQARYLKSVTSCRSLVLWGRSPKKAAACAAELAKEGFRVSLAQSPAELAAEANLIVTTTPSEQPLLYKKDIRPGTHITAMGSDTPDKQELDSEILAAADMVIADSISQCRGRGEIYRAIQAGLLDPDRVVELGSVISSAPRRREDNHITVADLTGVAVQDLKIAEAVLEAGL